MREEGLYPPHTKLPQQLETQQGWQPALQMPPESPRAEDLVSLRSRLWGLAERWS